MPVVSLYMPENCYPSQASVVGEGRRENWAGIEAKRERENVSFSVLMFLVFSEYAQVSFMSFKTYIFDRNQKLSGKKVYMYV